MPFDNSYMRLILAGGGGMKFRVLRSIVSSDLGCVFCVYICDFMKVNNFKVREGTVYLRVLILITFLFDSCGSSSVVGMNKGNLHNENNYHVSDKDTKIYTNLSKTIDTKISKEKKLNKEKYSFLSDLEEEVKSDVCQSHFNQSSNDSPESGNLSVKEKSIYSIDRGLKFPEKESSTCNKLLEYNNEDINKVLSSGDIIIMKDKKGILNHAAIFYYNEKEVLNEDVHQGKSKNELNNIGGVLSGIKRRGVLSHLRACNFDAIIYTFNPKGKDRNYIDKVRAAIGNQAKVWSEKLLEVLPGSSYNFEDLFLYMFHKRGHELNDLKDYDDIIEDFNEARNSCIENKYLNTLLFIKYTLRKNVSPSLYNGLTCSEFVIACIGSALLQDLLEKYCIRASDYENASNQDKIFWPSLKLENDPKSMHIDKKIKICEYEDKNSETRRIASIIVNHPSSNHNITYKLAVELAKVILKPQKNSNYSCAVELLHKPTLLEQKYGIYSSSANKISPNFNDVNINMLMEALSCEYDLKDTEKRIRWEEVINKGLKGKNTANNMLKINKASLPDYLKRIDTFSNLDNVVNNAMNSLGGLSDINIKLSFLEDLRPYLENGQWSRKEIKIKKENEDSFFVVKEFTRLSPTPASTVIPSVSTGSYTAFKVFQSFSKKTLRK